MRGQENLQMGQQILEMLLLQSLRYSAATGLSSPTEETARYWSEHAKKVTESIAGSSEHIQYEAMDRMRSDRSRKRDSGPQSSPMVCLSADEFPTDIFVQILLIPSRLRRRVDQRKKFGRA